MLLIRPDDVHVVEPLSTLDVPRRRQHDDAPAVDGGEVVLDAAAAQRVLDAVLDGLSGQRRFGDEELPVLGAKTIGPAVEREPRLREIAKRGRGLRRLNHAAVPATRPVLVHLLVAHGARGCADGSGAIVSVPFC